jgi:hypothetical protein
MSEHLICYASPAYFSNSAQLCFFNLPNKSHKTALGSNVFWSLVGVGTFCASHLPAFLYLCFNVFLSFFFLSFFLLILRLYYLFRILVTEFVNLLSSFDLYHLSRYN